MKVLISLLIALSLQASSIHSLVNELHNLSYSQKVTLAKTFLKAKPFDYQYTMTAIAWQESKFGKFKINLMDPSCGIFHIMPRYLSDSKWKQSRICERLILDYDFSFSTALQQIKYWENYWKSKRVQKVWSHTVMSYNAGYGTSKKYLNEIKKKIRALKIFVKGTSLNSKKD